MSQSISLCRRACHVVAFSSLLIFRAALAQEATHSASGATPDPYALEEIVVTAQRRSEDLSKVPLSISALSGADVQAMHVVDFADLSRDIPNVSFTDTGGPGLSTIEIRGISSQAGTAAIGVYMDDVSLTTRNLYSQGTAEPRFFDLDHVEVLRGPQGTLYGGGALGGVIRFIGNQPDLDAFGVSVQEEISQTDNSNNLNYNSNAVANLPLINETLALRVGVQRGYDAGYINLIDPNTGALINRDSNTNTWSVAKAALKWQINNAWSVTPAFFYQDMASGDTDTVTLNPFTNPISGASFTVPDLSVAKWLREPGADRLTVPSVTANGDLGFATLIAVASHYQRLFDRVQDGTTVNVPYLVSLYPAGSAVANGLADLTSAVDLRTAQEQSSFELRLASRAYMPGQGLPISWVAGAYGSSDVTQVWDNEPVYGINALFNSQGLDINSPGAFGGTSFPGAWPADDSSYFSHRYYSTRKAAAFGELTYYFRPNLHAILGAREEIATEDFSRQGNYYYTGCGGPSTCPLIADPPSAHFSAFTPHVNLTWDVTDSAMVYANLAKGYRLGSFNRPVPLYGTPSSPGSLQDLQSLGLCNGTVAGCANVIPSSYKADWLWSYELGGKATFFNDRLQVNSSIYYTTWNNTQQDLVLVISYYDFETNVGNVDTYGAELEMKGRVTDHLTLGLSGGTTNSTFAENLPTLGYSNGVLNVAKGARVPGVPDFSALASAEYTFQYSPEMPGFLRASYQQTGTSHGTAVQSAPDYLRPGYDTWDASTGLDWNGFKFSLFGKNLGNMQKILQRPNVQSVNEGFTIRPRTIGLSMDYRFGAK